MDDQADAFIDFAQAAEVTGESHPGANAVSLNVVRRNGYRATLTVPADDLQRLVSMLLLLGRTLEKLARSLLAAVPVKGPLP